MSVLKERAAALGHHSPNHDLAVRAVWPVRQLLPRRLDRALFAATVASTAVMGGAAAVHDPERCQRCAAHQHTWLCADAGVYELNTVHAVYDHPAMAAWVHMLMAAPVLLPNRRARIAARFAVLPLDLYLTYAVRTHRQLKAWCPQCREKRSGEE